MEIIKWKSIEEPLIVVLGVLIGVAYTTLLERKVLGRIQRREGPEVEGYKGLLQPIFDGIKLMNKEMVYKKSLGQEEM
jgi:NADH:ubiquinone oxidoreductase subunit H